MTATTRAFTAGRSRRGQPDGEGGAAPDGAVDLDLAAVLLDDAIADRQAEADVRPLVLGGEEGLEDALLDLGRDALAGVGDGEADLPVARERRYREAPARRHGGARVGGEVEQHLRQLSRVSPRARLFAVEDELEHDLLIFDQRLGQAQRVLDQLVEI